MAPFLIMFILLSAYLVEPFWSVAYLVTMLLLHPPDDDEAAECGGIPDRGQSPSKGARTRLRDGSSCAHRGECAERFRRLERVSPQEPNLLDWQQQQQQQRSLYCPVWEQTSGPAAAPRAVLLPGTNQLKTLQQ
jgi:hypothetical protein